MSVIVINIQNLLTGHITNSQDKFIYKFCTFANINYGQSELSKTFYGWPWFEFNNIPDMSVLMDDNNEAIASLMY